MATLRRLGLSDLLVSPLALGCWPMAGISTLHVDPEKVRATIRLALEAGINHFDTAYCYGYDGESDRYLREATRGSEDSVTIASKVGMHYDSNRVRRIDGSPERIRSECEAIRKRLDRPCLDLLYLHTPDPTIPIQRSAQALAELRDLGHIRWIGVCNVNEQQLRSFCDVVRPEVVQIPFNMLQPDSVAAVDTLVKAERFGLATYWPLMKGLLTGKFPRDHRFEAGDVRSTYSMFQGKEWELNQRFLDRLRRLAQEFELPVTALVLAWTMIQPNITTVLAGARSPDQLHEQLLALRISLTEDVQQDLHAWINERRQGSPGA